MVILNCC